MEINTQAAIQSFRDKLSDYCPLGEASWKLLEGILETKPITAKRMSLKEGHTCRFIDYLYAGSFRTFYNKEGEEISTALYVPGQFITNMKSLSRESPSEVNMQALEDSVVVRLQKQDMIGLYQKSAELQAAGRGLLEAMVVNENEWKEMYTLFDPAERYAFLMNKAPELVQKISLQHIASFLGIRRETLSRIRSGLNKQ
jgi:CRP-like cAMP-binding protein